jgi:hypothetical protein
MNSSLSAFNNNFLSKKGVKPYVNPPYEPISNSLANYLVAYYSFDTNTPEIYGTNTAYRFPNIITGNYDGTPCGILAYSGNNTTSNLSISFGMPSTTSKFGNSYTTGNINGSQTTTANKTTYGINYDIGSIILSYNNTLTINGRSNAGTTISFWVNIVNNWVYSNYMCPFNFLAGTGGTGGQICLWINKSDQSSSNPSNQTTGGINSICYPTNSANKFSAPNPSTGSINPGSFYFIALTINNNNTATLYVNNQSWGSLSNVSPIGGKYNLMQFAGNGNNNYPAMGIYDDFRIYNFCMTATQVSNLYTFTVPPNQ